MLGRIKRLLGQRTLQLEQVNKIVTDLESELSSMNLKVRVNLVISENKLESRGFDEWFYRATPERESFSWMCLGGQWRLAYITPESGAVPLIDASALTRTRFTGLLPRFIEQIEGEMEHIVEFSEDALPAARDAKVGGESREGST